MNSRANGGISAGDGKNVQNNPPRWQACKAAMRAFLCKRACLPDPMRKRTRASAVLWGASLRLCCSRALRVWT